jgi:hypothetical protein
MKTNTISVIRMVVGDLALNVINAYAPQVIVRAPKGSSGKI